MHAKFNLNPKGKDWQGFQNSGKTIHNKNKATVKSNLERFKNADGALNAGDIIENWFPNIKANIFLSHSHKDEELVIGLAGWLYDKLGLTSFIDSTVWGYSDELLKEIDNKYCKNDSGETYNYDLRNRSTSHVHMMLSSALMDMIDQCECIIFVNTNNSFIPKDYIKSNGETESPWIYSEISMTRMLRQRSPERHRKSFAMDSTTASMEMLAESRELRVVYPIDTFHLTPLSVYELEKLQNTGKKGTRALDELYSMKKENN